MDLKRISKRTEVMVKLIEKRVKTNCFCHQVLETCQLVDESITMITQQLKHLNQKTNIDPFEDFDL